MRSAVRLLVVTLTGLVVALLPVHAVAESHPSDREYGLVAGHQPAPPPTGPSTAPSAPTVELDPAETESDRAESRRKIVMGVASALLIGVVIWGRSIRRKKAKPKK
ncbi:hypothetical protein [Actinophytocola algeriensis]|uniref:Uncharacterized protein n=1 Tax=Actinophytocola algeriensis TaxID=1768010 RepID=A0A7W7PYU3_9PSEU|nr:hypothetical protein [Actinophytocola algeriensis]MBB4903827.1 hypothetical protein [Actinophytocola algeriensis]MBE1477316.1 hypothetical protein [Actinophytocola algeriensis]